MDIADKDVDDLDGDDITRLVDELEEVSLEQDDDGGRHGNASMHYANAILRAYEVEYSEEWNEIFLRGAHIEGSPIIEEAAAGVVPEEGDKVVEDLLMLLLLAHEKMVRKQISSLVDSWADVDDILIDTWVTAFNNIRYYKKGNFGGWLRTIARNKSVDFLRRKSSKDAFETAIPAQANDDEFLEQNGYVDFDDPEGVLLAEDTALAVVRAYYKVLSEEEAQIFFARNVQGKSIKEISKLRGLEEPHVRVLLSRAVTKLKNYVSIYV